MLSKTEEILRAVERGDTTVEDALLKLREEPFSDIDFAKIDHHRALRQGAPEVIYSPGKPKEQLLSIVRAMAEHGQEIILLTKLDADAAEYIGAEYPIRYDAASRLGVIGDFPKPDGIGTILIATAGTGDIPIAEEAAVTAEALGNRVKRLYDIGVSSPQTLLSHLPDILQASVIVAIAGMEGALACVLAGYADCPIIAVPTDIGYGASFGGLAALSSMLTSCSSGVSVVNINNGFGAGYQASMINHVKAK
jgi:NCAIR mutase (PurE)-related protein